MSNEELIKRIEGLEYKVACQDKYIHENDIRIRIMDDWIYKLEEAADIKLVESDEMPMFRDKTEELCKSCKYHDCDHLCLYCIRYARVDNKCRCDDCKVCVDYKKRDQLIVKKPAEKQGESEEIEQ